MDRDREVIICSMYGGPPSTSPQMRIPELDGLRGIAVLVVVFDHVFAFDGFPQTFSVRVLAHFLGFGWLGVDIFFVLSGFLITRILLSDGSDWKSFYRNRAFRILPAFLIVFVVVLSFVHQAPRLQVLFYLFFLGNFTDLAGLTLTPLAHFWSLAVEEQFYLIWPQAAWRISKPALLKLALCLAAFSFLGRFAAIAAGAGRLFLYKSTPLRMDGIALGCAIAVVAELPSAREWLARRWSVIAWVALAVVVAAVVFLRRSLVRDFFLAELFAIPAVSVLTATLVFAASQHRLPSALSAALRNRVLAYFGARSYGLYLINFPVSYGLGQLSAAVHWKLALAHPARTLALTEISSLALSILLAEASWRFVERPAQRLKKRFFERKT